MHLSRLKLNLRNSQVRRDLADAYDMHRSLVRAFVQDRDQKPPRFLWRVEPESAWREPVVLVQSAIEPDWSVLSRNGYFNKPAESKALDLNALIEPGSLYRFRLFANPTVTREGKRYGLSTEEDQTAWLGRQAKKGGFSVETVLVTSSEVVNLRGDDICLQQACFEGVLRATDVVSLRRTVEVGIGPGKAFGFGLLSLSPHRSG